MTDPAFFNTDSLNGTLLAFSPEVHCQLLGESLPESGFSDDAVKMTCYVQEPADNRFSGFKTDGRLWMHYMRQMFGMERDTCLWIKRTLNRPESPADCNPEEAYLAGEKFTFEGIAYLIRTSSPPELDDQTAGKILFLIGCLAHAVQDKKHLDGNPQGINSLEHFVPPGWSHVCTDLDPPPKMRREAIKRTKELADHLDQFLKQRFGPARGAELMAQIKKFDLKGRRVEDYYPDEDFIRRFVPSFRPNTDIPAIG